MLVLLEKIKQAIAPTQIDHERVFQLLREGQLMDARALVAEVYGSERADEFIRNYQAKHPTPKAPTPSAPTPTPPPVEVETLASEPLPSHELVIALPDKEQRLQQIKAELRRPENAPLLKLIKATPLQIYGPQRSRKSSLAWAIALLRQVALGFPTELMTPHMESDNPPPPCFAVYGQGRDYQGIGERMRAYYDKIQAGRCNPVTRIWDEFSRYEEELEGDYLAMAKGLVKSFLSESEKHKDYEIIVTHGDTASFVGGTSGTSSARKKGFIKVERCVALDDLGTKQYDPRIRIYGLDGGFDAGSKVYEVRVPDWFCPRYLLKLFPELAIPANAPNAQEKVKSELMRLYQAAQSQDDYDYREALKRAIAMLRSRGVGNSDIIKDVLLFRNTKYQNGKQLLMQLEGEGSDG